MKKFDPSESGIYDAYREPSHIPMLLTGIGLVIGFVIILWVLLEWSYKT
jgi:hypothetical protein